jgi:hypothetical protein
MIALVRADVSDVRWSRRLHRGVGRRGLITAGGHRKSERGQGNARFHHNLPRIFDWIETIGTLPRNQDNETKTNRPAEADLFASGALDLTFA